MFRGKRKDFRSNKENNPFKPRSLIPKLIDKVKEETRTVISVGTVLIGMLTAGVISTTPNTIYGLDLFDFSVSNSTITQYTNYKPNKKDTIQDIITVEPTKNKQVAVIIPYITPGSIIGAYMDNVDPEKMYKQVGDIILAGALNQPRLLNQSFDQFEQILRNYDIMNGRSGENSLLYTFRLLLEEYKDNPQRLVEMMFGSKIEGLYTGKFDTTYLAPPGTPLRTFQTTIMRGSVGGKLVKYNVNIEEQFTIVGASTWRNWKSLNHKFGLYEINVRFKNKHFKIEVNNEENFEQTRSSNEEFNTQALGTDLKFNIKRFKYILTLSIDLEKEPYIPPSPKEDLMGYLDFIYRIGFSNIPKVSGLISKTAFGIQSLYYYNGLFSFNLTYFKVGEKRILNPGGGQETRFLGVPRTYFTEIGTRALYKPPFLGYEVYGDLTGSITDLVGSWRTVKEGDLDIKEYVWGSVRVGSTFKVSRRITADVSGGYAWFPEDDIVQLVGGVIWRPRYNQTFYKWIIQVSKSVDHGDGGRVMIKLEVTTQ